MNEALKAGFPLFRDEETLRNAVDVLCARYGKVKSLRIFPATLDTWTGTLHCLCLLQLDPAQAQLTLQSKRKLSTVGTALAFVADVDTDWNGPRA
jgi:hypothetical protein